jgi:hypothetical protein
MRTSDLIQQDSEQAYQLTARQLEEATRLVEEKFGAIDPRSQDGSLVGAVLITLSENYRAREILREGAPNGHPPAM